jgi:hypothetical protein
MDSDVEKQLLHESSRQIAAEEEKTAHRGGLVWVNRQLQRRIIATSEKLRIRTHW